MLKANLAVLGRRYPNLLQRIEASELAESVQVIRANDGGVAYTVDTPAGRQFLTDPVAPTKKIQTQLDSFSSHLQNPTQPVLIVGLYPGNELLFVFDLVDKITTPHCSQPIWVCLDSILCLKGFLMAWDARKVLDSDRVNLFWHTEIPAKISFLREHQEFPHTFILLSGAPDTILNSLLPPFAQLVVERDEAARSMSQANDLYYDSLSDEVLAKTIAGQGGRKPRLMMPTCSWSTFVQYSTRDTGTAFEELGWDVRILKMDAMLTPYCLINAIQEFKPDVFLFIDHMRYEAEQVYPRNMMFITWIQDEMPNLQSKAAGEKMAEYAMRNRRDLVVGYVDHLDTKYGYPQNRLVPLNIGANPRVFHPVALASADKAKYGCDLAFMSNVSMPSEQVMEEKILPAVKPIGISRTTCLQIHDDLWKFYRGGDTLTDRSKFLEWLMKYPEFSDLWGKLQTGDSIQESGDNSQKIRIRTEHRTPNTQTQDNLLRLFYWRLNDTIYRHIVLEWADELGADLHLYGMGWESNPRFRKYSCGLLQHGQELNVAYQAANHCLHLNITHGMHQRLWEITAAGGRPLVRTPWPSDDGNLVFDAAMRRFVAGILKGRGIATAITHGMHRRLWETTIAKPSPHSPKTSPFSDGKPLQDAVLQQFTTGILQRHGIANAIESLKNQLDRKLVFDWMCFTVLKLAKTVPIEHLTETFARQVEETIERTLASTPNWILDWPSCHFVTKVDFIAKIHTQGSRNVCTTVQKK